MTGEQGKRKKGKGIHTKGRRTRWTEFHKACKPPPRANIKFNLPEIFSLSLSCFHEINKIRARDSNRVVSAKDRRTVTRGELNGWTENTVGLLPPREPPREFYARHGMDRDLISAFRWRRRNGSRSNNALCPKIYYYKGNDFSITYSKIPRLDCDFSLIFDSLPRGANRLNSEREGRKEKGRERESAHPWVSRRRQSLS